jgi:hypothetical protein
MSSIKTISCLILFISSLSFSAHANRPSELVENLKKWNFQPSPSPTILYQNFSLDTVRASAELPFPIEFLLESDQLGAVIHQFQDWTTPAYFHAGLDIRALENQEIFSPVFGNLEAGYYSYVDESDGRSTKYFLPLKDVLNGQKAPPWGELYFEVAVIDRNGYRFEMHHVDPKSLGPELTKKILNHEAVAPGEFLGRLIAWPRRLAGLDFHHLHYNIVSPQGVYLNPLALSEKVADLKPPEIVNVYATSNGRCGSSAPVLTPLSDNTPLPTQKFIVIETLDKINDGRFPQTPAKISASFVGNKKFTWDFSQALLTEEGVLPNIGKMYLYYLCDEKGFVQVASRSLRFYIKIPVPENYKGPIHLKVSDQFENHTERIVSVINDEK